MNPSASKARDHEWLDYYERFPYFSAEAVRDGCHPRIMEHEGPTAKAIVLIHGLTDSPYFMTAIGDYFFRNLGYNVYLPLLQCHGLKEPKGMEGVTLDEWKANVNFAVDIAASKAHQVSIGGLSTGGALSFYTAVKNPKINGTLYLFSAALDLAGGISGVVGDLVGDLVGESERTITAHTCGRCRRFLRQYQASDRRQSLPLRPHGPGRRPGIVQVDSGNRRTHQRIQPERTIFEASLRGAFRE